MFNCKESIELLLGYLDGDLPEEDMRALDEHFQGCPPCVDFLRSYRNTPTLCRKHLAQKVAEKMPDEIASKLTSFLRQRIKK